LGNLFFRMINKSTYNKYENAQNEYFDLKTGVEKEPELEFQKISMENESKNDVKKDDVKKGGGYTKKSILSNKRKNKTQKRKKNLYT